MPDLHILRQFVLPDRYEDLRGVIGDRVVELLVEPAAKTKQALHEIGVIAATRHQGLFVPVLGASGTGKTTLANALSIFFPDLFTNTLIYASSLDYDTLNNAIIHHASSLNSDDQRIIPVLVDHRENAPASEEEMSNLKRFLRGPSAGARAAVVWPETTELVAAKLAESYKAIAGSSPVELPVRIEGPPRATWSQIAKTTMALCNSATNLEELGVDPATYDPEKYPTLGEYMRGISHDFAKNLSRLLLETQKAVNLVVAFASESFGQGVLSQLCVPGSQFGLLDANSLISATSDSAIGKWWDARRGQLVQSIYRLNARAFAIPPSTAIMLLRRCGAQEVKADLDSLGIQDKGDWRLNEYLDRSELGKYLTGKSTGTYEARGKPPEDAKAAFALLAQKGFTYGKDKRLNESMAEAFSIYLKSQEIPFSEVIFEKALEFCPLIPDNAIVKASEVITIEYTWRSGDFLTTKNRATCAQYILGKIRNYATQLKWIPG